jgi:hypothetical protein
VDERINREIFLELSEMAAEVETSAGVSAKRHSNRVCNLKRALYIDNSQVGGSFEVPLQVEEEGKYSLSVFQCLYRTGGIWKVSLKGGGQNEILLDPAMDFFDPYLAWEHNRPENFIYGTWFEKKLGIHGLTPGEYRVRFECVGAHPLSRSEEGGGPGFNCRLDGISLRRFPWDDLPGQMQQYLADEEALFAARVKEAEGMVAKLSQAVEEYRSKTGRYPDALGRLVGTALERIPYDPWDQPYQYVCPGKFHPEGFDLFSWHGNSRDTAVWIGNWPTPYRIPGALEGEDLPIASVTEGIRTSRQQIGTASFPPLSQGRLRFVRLGGEGDRITFELPSSVEAGRYGFKVRYVTSRDYGIIQLSLNDVPLGKGIDTYTPKIMTRIVDYGEVEVKPGRNLLQLRVCGKNERSSGHYAGLDAVMLVPSR